MDGRLSCEEFVLAMHLCDVARSGENLPPVLPPDLQPPAFRRPSVAGAMSVTSPTGVPAVETLPGAVATSPPPADGLISPVSFEDKRKENFDKGTFFLIFFLFQLVDLILTVIAGQAELDKRRRALAEQQRREQDERERKEREEQERKEKLRQEQDRRRQAELEKQMAKQREIEMVIHVPLLCNFAFDSLALVLTFAGEGGATSQNTGTARNGPEGDGTPKTVGVAKTKTSRVASAEAKGTRETCYPPREALKSFN